MGILDRISKAFRAMRKPETPVSYSKSPKPHHEYFVERRSEGYYWLARFYEPVVDGNLNLVDTRVRTESGAEKTEVLARKAAIAWCAKQAGAK